MLIAALVLAIAATVLAFIFIVPEKKGEKMNGFCKFFHKALNFKFLIIEKILQALYIFSTAMAILTGFFMLFMVTESFSFYGGVSKTWLGGYGLLLMILGPIVIRVIFEFAMMVVLLVKNVISINNKLKNQNGDGNADDVFAAPSVSDLKAAFKPAQTAAPAAPVAPAAPAAPAAPVAPAPLFCTKCGARLNPDGTCPNCQQ